jgi:membrane associated rhomboid family serine protease
VQPQTVGPVGAGAHQIPWPGATHYYRFAMKRDPEGNAVKFGHDTVMGILLAVSGLLTIAYVRAPSRTLRILVLIGAVVTIVIGALLFFGLE